MNRYKYRLLSQFTRLTLFLNYIIYRLRQSKGMKILNYKLLKLLIRKSIKVHLTLYKA
jgi:hypothetical protein